MELDDLILVAIALRAQRRRRRHPLIKPLQLAVTRRPILECLDSPTLLFHSTGIKLETFQRLCSWLRDKTTLEKNNSKLPLEEKVLVFLRICRKGADHRETQIAVTHPTSTISSSFRTVLAAVVHLHKEVVRQPSSSDPVPTRIRENPKFYPYFKDAIGAIDGTHIPVKVPATCCGPWRNRRGILSQNVFAACSFDLRFTFVYPGWEGSAHDSTVATDALMKGYWQPAKGKYFLADAGYSISDYYLVPFKKVRSNLCEQATAGLRPQTKEELFNLRHATLQNAAERVFDVLKKKFKILTHPAEFSIETQVDLVLALTALYNFISDLERIDDDDFSSLEQSDPDADFSPLEQYDPDEDGAVRLPDFSPRLADAKVQMNNFRAEIATRMFNDYLP